MISAVAGPGGAPAQEPGALRILLHFRSPADALAAGDSGAAVELVESQPISGRAPLQRDPQLSPHHLVVVALDAEDRELSRTVIADPRFVRGETAEPSGELVSEELVLVEATGPLVVPDDPRMRRLRIFQPVWTGEIFVLNPMGTIDLPSDDGAASSAGDLRE